MGVRQDFENQYHGDVLEQIYFVKNKTDYGNCVGTKLSDTNNDPFFYRWEDSMAFTIKAIFAGRDYDKRLQSLRESCDATCLVCGCEILADVEDRWNYLETGVMIGFSCDDRAEMLCVNCYNKWLSFRDPYYTDLNFLHEKHCYSENRNLDIEGQISLMRFMLKEHPA